MYNLSLKQIYFGRKKLHWSLTNYPDLLKTEKRRRDNVLKWWLNFKKAKKGEKLRDVNYYVLSTKINPLTKVGISLKEGDFNIVTLSALKTSVQMPIIMVMPSDKKIPKEGSYIRIITPMKEIIEKIGTNYVDDAIYVEEVMEEDSSSIYKEIIDIQKLEKNIILKFIKENLIKNDDYIAKSFQTPISSSPYF